MTELEKWLAERRRIHAAASKGPWMQNVDDGIIRGLDVYTDATGDDINVRWYHQDGDIRTDSADDAAAIVDAHTHLPAFFAAVESVLERHQREMDPFGITRCESCHSHTGEQEEYPCEELRDIEEAVRRG